MKLSVLKKTFQRNFNAIAKQHGRRDVWVPAKDVQRLTLQAGAHSDKPSRISDPEANNKIIILFLAHKGVNQPKVWNKWKDMLEKKEDKERLIFCVHCPDPYEHPTISGIEFCKANRLDGYEDKTDWCGVSLVKAYKFALEQILRLHGPPQMIYLVSGADIPVCKPEKCLFNKQAILREGIQWCAITGSMAALFCSYATDSWFEIKKRKWFFSQPRSGCPDEQLIVFAFNEIHDMFYDLNIQKIHYSTPVTDFLLRSEHLMTKVFKSFENSNSPVTWKNLEDKNTLCEIDFEKVKKNVNLQYKWSLQECVVASLMEKQIFFMRKVAPFSTFFKFWKEKIGDMENLKMPKKTYEPVERKPYISKKLLDIDEIILRCFYCLNVAGTMSWEDFDKASNFEELKSMIRTIEDSEKATRLEKEEDIGI